jgi:hypothetical protein
MVRIGFRVIFARPFGETLPDITLPGPADVIFKDSLNVFGV